jgi:hypothetical protein
MLVEDGIEPAGGCKSADVPPSELACEAFLERVGEESARFDCDRTGMLGLAVVCC